MQRVGELLLHQWLTAITIRGLTQRHQWLTAIAIRGLTRHQLKQTIEVDGKRTDAVKRLPLHQWLTAIAIRGLTGHQLKKNRGGWETYRRSEEDEERARRLWRSIHWAQLEADRVPLLLSSDEED